MFVVSVHYLVEQDLEEGYSCHVGEDASLGVFGEGSAVDAYSGTFGDVEDFGQPFTALPCAGCRIRVMVLIRFLVYWSTGLLVDWIFSCRYNRYP